VKWQGKRAGSRHGSIGNTFDDKAAKSFVKATLEDLDGSIEVMVCRMSIQELRNCGKKGILSWSKGNGVRDDGIQLSCKRSAVMNRANKKRKKQAQRRLNPEYG